MTPSGSQRMSPYMFPEVRTYEVVYLTRLFAHRRFRSTQKARLFELTKNANDSKNLLKDKCDIAERILKLSELGRKMETEGEKVAPFYVSSVEEEIETQAEEMTKKAREEGEGAGGERQRVAENKPQIDPRCS